MRPRLAHLFTASQWRDRWPLRDALPAPGAWHPYPTVVERAAWEAVPAERRDPVVSRAQAIAGTPWPALPATLFAEFRRVGDRERFQRPHFERRDRLATLTLAECLSGRGSFVDEVVDGIWAICEETTWCLPAHSFSPRLPGTPLPDVDYPVVDLFAAETGALLAWTSYLLAPELERELQVVVDRIRHEARRRLLVPYRCSDDWHWLRGHGPGQAPNNWNPWIHSNLLVVTLLLEDDVQVRASLVARILRGLDDFLDGYGEDGGCDEGVSYWWRAGASLFECLETLHSASGGRWDGFQLPVVREIGAYLHRMHIGGPWYVNFADGAPLLSEGGELLHRFARRVGDRDMTAHALAMRSSPARGEASIGRRLPELFDAEYAEAPAEEPPLVRDSWLPSIQVLTCRHAAGRTEGLFLAAKGGSNGESHNHNDVGTFVVALDGEPVLIDAGVGVYTRQTFGPDRYQIWTMQSAYHSLPLVDGHQQAPGGEHRARDVRCGIGDDATWLRLDIGPAYPPAAGVLRWLRTLRLERAGEGRVVVDDECELDHEPGELALHLLSWAAPDASEPGRLVYGGRGRSLSVAYDGDALAASTEQIEIDDARLSAAWGESIHRTVLRVREPSATGRWTLHMTPMDP
jgi:hypothetical protein